MKIIKSLKALKEEDHRRALYGTLVFIMLLILFFLLVSLEEPDPPLEEPILEIEMPQIEFEGSEAKGGSQSNEMSSNPQTDNNNIKEETSHVETQETSDVNVSSANGSADNDNEEEKQPEVDESLTFGKNNGKGTGTGEGDDFGKGTGVGGDGKGNRPGDGTHNPNRKVVKPPTFDANSQEEGKIVLDIWVDENGNVYKTRVNESSTSGSSYLISLAKKAAKTMKYEKKPGAGIEYVGSKAFTFRKV
ncbi:MAG: energy transducer TonB [Flavobacteriales bacterium]|nr:energy transducer TonB [Flavobacteriales bacterium]